MHNSSPHPHRASLPNPTNNHHLDSLPSSPSRTYPPGYIYTYGRCRCPLDMWRSLGRALSCLLFVQVNLLVSPLGPQCMVYSFFERFDIYFYPAILRRPVYIVRVPGQFSVPTPNNILIPNSSLCMSLSPSSLSSPSSLPRDRHSSLHSSLVYHSALPGLPQQQYLLRLSRKPPLQRPPAEPSQPVLRLRATLPLFRLQVRHLLLLSLSQTPFNRLVFESYPNAVQLLHQPWAAQLAASRRSL
jgi:hypothetical protein